MRPSSQTWEGLYSAEYPEPFALTISPPVAAPELSSIMQHRVRRESRPRQPRADSGSAIKVHPCEALQSGAVAIGKHSSSEYTKHRDFWRWVLLVVRFTFDRPRAHLGPAV
jgi:hypothetical protein